MIRRHPLALFGLAQFEAGGVREDNKVHAVAAIGGVRYALCYAGVIQCSFTSLFRRTSPDACESCAAQAQPLW